MKKSLLITAALVMGATLAGCQHLANITGNLDNITAHALQVDESQVTDTSNLKAGAFTTSWDAVVDGQSYRCSATDMYTEASCQPV